MATVLATVLKIGQFFQTSGHSVGKLIVIVLSVVKTSVIAPPPTKVIITLISKYFALKALLGSML